MRFRRLFFRCIISIWYFGFLKWVLYLISFGLFVVIIRLVYKIFWNGVLWVVMVLMVGMMIWVIIWLIRVLVRIGVGE